MFVNYRKEVKFTDRLRKLIETFASFAASSISNGLIFERSRRFLHENLKRVKPAHWDMIMRGTLHDAHKTHIALHSKFHNFLDEINDIYSRKKMSHN